MRRTLLLCASIVFAIACGDNVTEPIPDRTSAVTPPVSFATTTTEDGLSISTDKDDYSPGDTVHFTGSGWPVNDVLNIRLDDEPATHPPHTWTVNVQEDGTFHDSTYVVDVGDLGVTFTLAATTTQADPTRSLSVQFTDNQNPQLTQVEAYEVSGCSSATPTALVPAVNHAVCARVSVDVQGGSSTAQFFFQWINPGGTIVRTQNATGNTGDLVTDILPATSVTAGLWTVRTCRGNASTTVACNSAANTITRLPSPPGGNSVPRQFIVPAPTTTSIISSQNPSTPGSAVTFTATVTSGSPSSAVTVGQVSFKTGGTSCSDATQLQAQQPVDGNGQVTFTTSALATGTHVISACYGGATGFLTSEGSVTQQVNNTTTVTEVASSANPSVTGQSVTFTATVKNGGSPIGAHGSVSFRQGGTDCTNGTEVKAATALNGSGQATYATSFSATGSPFTIRACYGGATGFDPSYGSISQVVDKANTSTEVTTSKTPTVYSEPVTFSVTVTVSSPGSGIPGGNVTLKDGSCAASVVAGPNALDGTGKVSFTGITSLSVATHTIAACYEGSGDFEGSSGTVTQVVNQAATTTSVISSDDHSVFSQSVTFTATVEAEAAATATPNGNVSFHDGTQCTDPQIGASKPLNSSGVATSDATTDLSVGTHTITACYAGNTNFKDSNGNVTQVVDQTATTTTVVSSDEQSVYSQSVNFTATVAAEAAATVTPNGTVTFHDGATCSDPQIGTSKTLNGSGVTTSDATTSLSVGTHTITACYAGNTNFKASDGSVTQTVEKASTTTVVTTSGSPSILHQPVTFTAVVTANSPATATPVGSVTFHDGSTCSATQLGGTKSLSGGSAASDQVTELAAGNHTIKGCYQGNENFTPSNGSVAQQVQYVFDGLYAPVDRPNTMNLSKAGQAVPLKWRLTDYNGAPVLDFAAAALGVAVSGMTCDAAGSLDQIEEYAGNSGLQNLGNGYYQYNWKTPTSYANTCRQIGLNLGEGFTRGPLANFNFKK